MTHSKHIQTLALFALFLNLFFLGAASAATLSSTVSRSQLSSNETLTLTVTYDEQVNASLLDLSTLSKDFQILSSSPQRSSSVSTINGKTTRQSSTVWTITLVPKREGKLSIPMFDINGARSQSISITVDNSKAANVADQPLQVWVVASGAEIYPNQQLIVTVELSAARDVSDLNGSPLLVNGAEVESLGQDSFQRVDNGVARQVVVLKYAVFAQQAGDISIPIMTFTGIQGGQRSFFGTRGNKVVARSEQMTIKVAEPPKDKPHPWFPAKNVTISSSWSADITNLNPGVPVTRTISIIANGQKASAIPPLSRAGDIEGLKSYQDQAQLESQPGADGFVSTRVESEALVANRAGSFTLPELRVNWWNTKTRQWQTAILPAETLEVSGSAAASTSMTIDTSAPSLAENASVSGGNYFWQIAAGLLALVCILQSWIIFRSKRAPVTSIKQDLQSSTEPQCWRTLQQELTGGDAIKIRKALLRWGQEILAQDRPTSLKLIAQQSNDDELAATISGLDKQLYSDGSDIDTKKLSRLLKKYRSAMLEQNKTTNSQHSGLQALYKTTA